MRNLIAHRSGQCFRTNLGKGMFGNDKCIKEGINLSEQDRTVIQKIAEMEKSWSCKIDTSQSNIRLNSKTLIDRLSRFPIRSIDESGCTNYLGKEVMLYAAPDMSSRIVGSLKKGMDIGFSYDSVGGWTVIQVGKGYETIAMGWINYDKFEYNCENYAG